MKRSSLFLTCCGCLLATILIAGCAPKTKKLDAKESDKKFIDLLKDEYKYTPKLFRIGKTLWVYMADERELFSIIATGKVPASQKQFSVLYAETAFSNNTFTVDYDIITPTKTSGTKGLGTDYSDAFSTEYRDMLNAVSRVYLDCDDAPDFIRFVFTDTKKGVEVMTTLATIDLNKYYSYILPYEEFSQRLISETNGDPKIVGDTEGTHLKLEDVRWSDFLAQQITNRINFKFQNSDFPPKEEKIKAILAIAANALGNYDFHDFTGIQITDLRANERAIFSRSECEALKKEDPQKGQFHVIKFNLPSPPPEETTMPEQETLPTEE